MRFGVPPTRFLHLRRGPLAVLDVEPARRTAPRATALLVPGYTGSKEDFLPVLELLARAGHRVVAMDQRGQYETPGPDDPARYTVAELAAEVGEVVGALGDGPVHLVGHSFGGLVSRAAVLARPALVRSLTLLGSGPAALTGPRVERLHALVPVLRRGGMPAVYDAMEAFAARGTTLPPTHLRAFLRRRFLTSSPAGLSGMGAALLVEPDRTADLAALGVPVLVAYGAADDAWAPAVQADMARRLGAAHVVLPGAAHSPAAEVPLPTARALLAHWASAEGDSGR